MTAGFKVPPGLQACLNLRSFELNLNTTTTTTTTNNNNNNNNNNNDNDNRCSPVQLQGPDRHPATARVKWNKEVNKVVMESFY